MAYHGRIFHPRKTKAILKAHARRRAEERYGIALTKSVSRQMIQAVQEGKTTFVHRSSNNRTVHDMEINGEIVRFVYDHRRKTPVTFLNRDHNDWRGRKNGTGSDRP